MQVLDTIYRIFMFVLPFALCFAAYIWMGKKALRVPQKAARIIALVLIAGGLAYTLYRLISSVGGIMRNELFEYVILIVAVAVLAVASIVMTLGEPDEKDRSTAEQKTTNEEGKENGLGQ
jgi:high-affinity Fe2+/Pb2+ permease